jgi:hypothetical protein
MYWLLVFLILPFRLNEASYRIFRADHASSAVIIHVPSIFIGLVYLYGVVTMGSMGLPGLCRFVDSHNLGGVDCRCLATHHLIVHCRAVVAQKYRHPRQISLAE